MKLVKENLSEAMSFEKTGDPMKGLNIGKDSTYVKEKKFEELQKQGIDFYLNYVNPEDNDKVKQRFIENIYDIETVIKKLKKLNIPIISISGSLGLDIKVEIFQIIDSQHVILECVSEDDAKMLIDIIKKLSVRDYDNFRIEKGETRLNIWKKSDTHKWLNELENNRKKYKILK